MFTNIMDIVKKRRSIRNYNKEKVSTEVIMELLEGAVYAPTGSNIQPWYFVVVNDERINKQIKAFSPGLFGNPPNLIIVCRDKKKACEKGGVFRSDELSIIDISMAAQNILLLATEKGISTCTVKSYNKQAIEKILKLPDEISAELIISIGYSDNYPTAPPKKRVNEVTFINQWGKINE